MIHWFRETSYLAWHMQDAVLVLFRAACECCAGSQGLAWLVVTGLSEAELCQNSNSSEMC